MRLGAIRAVTDYRRIADNAPSDEGVVVIHRWMGDGFEHVTDGSRPCPCLPHRVPADDPRTVDQIVADMEDDPLERPQ